MSVSGVFLGEGETYESVIEKDLITCGEHGVTPQQIGERIKFLLNEYYKAKLKVGQVMWDDPPDEIIELVRKMPPPLNCQGITKKKMHKINVETVKCWFPAIVETEFGRFLIISQGTLGSQHCLMPVPGRAEPLRGAPRDEGICGSNSYGSTDYVICNLSITDPVTGEHPSISFGGLVIHLLIKHSFFEGNVMYRLDPINAIHVLGFPPREVSP